MCIENTCPSNIQSPVATAALIFWLIGHQGEKEKHVTEMEWGGGAALQKQTETVRQEETETVRQQETEIVRQQEPEKECA